MIKTLLRNRAGNFGIMAALAATPLILGVGVAVDGSRYYAAQNHLQDVADALSLSLAASSEQDQKELEDRANGFLGANIASNTIDNVVLGPLLANAEQVDVTLHGGIDATFMRLGGFEYLPVTVSALALRAPVQKVEVSLVLDNTWSMSEEDGSGISRIATLKQAAAELIDGLFTESEEGTVRIGIVPYADYVNVGIQHRDAAWLDVPPDVPAVKATCKEVEVTHRKYCVKKGPKYTYTVMIDGVEETRTGRDCIDEDIERFNPPKREKQCSGGKKARAWYGCVGSRTAGTARLNDRSPSIRYPGLIDTGQKCLNPIVPLTNDKDALLAAIENLIINIGGYKPYTYIPAGLIWGVNLLSPPEPMAQAADYDPDNVNPRKVIILMTDGENTRRFRDTDGRHVGVSSKETVAERQIGNTNSDTLAICTYAKNNKIEVFTVAFMVETASAREMLEDCASDEFHYYDASDRQKLLDAFEGIARSINQVRLAR